jgi:hypothetical protein
VLPTFLPDSPSPFVLGRKKAVEENTSLFPAVIPVEAAKPRSTQRKTKTCNGARFTISVILCVTS